MRSYKVSCECYKAFKAAVAICRASQQLLVVRVAQTPLPLQGSFVPGAPLPGKCRAIPCCPPQCSASVFRRPWDSLFNTAATVSGFAFVHWVAYPSSYYYPCSCYQTSKARRGIVCVKLCVCIKCHILCERLVSAEKYIPLEYSLISQLWSGNRNI